MDGNINLFNLCVEHPLFTLGTGGHSFQLRDGFFGNPIGELVAFTILQSDTTILPIDVTDLTGVVSGTLTIDGVPPPEFSTGLNATTGTSGTSARVLADGSFRFLLTPGVGTASVFHQGNAIGTFPFEVIAGQVIAIGAPIGNTPTGSNVEVVAINPDGTPSPVTLTFHSVDQGGTTTLAQTSTGPTAGPPAPSDFKLGNPPTYFNINTTAEFSGDVEVCFDYSGVSFQNEPGLKLFHFIDGGWVNITASLDTANNIICGIAQSFSFFAAFEPDVVEVAIDIKPGSFPNSINPKSTQLIPVTILTTLDFDAASVDALSVGFGPASAPEAHGKRHIQDVDGDGDLDLLLHFKANATGIQCGDASASLEGQTFDGQPIRGLDSIKTVRCGA